MTELLTPDQGAALGCLVFLAAIGLTLFALLREVTRKDS